MTTTTPAAVRVTLKPTGPASPVVEPARVDGCRVGTLTPVVRVVVCLRLISATGA